MNADQTTSCYLAALSGRRPERLPVWFMRQAGRVLPAYRELRATKSFEELLRDPELGARITLMPLEVLDVDAAILFTDLLAPIEAMGIEVAYKPGPVLARTVRGPHDLGALRLDEDSAPFRTPIDAARAARAALPRDKALIGFVGAPFTLGAYLYEGHGSKNWAAYRAAAYAEPAFFTRLWRELAERVLTFALAQAEAGCDAIQIFDSWAGAAEPAFFAEFVAPAVTRIVEGLHARGVPAVYFVNGAAGHLETMVATGADCLGVDWRLPMAEVCRRLPPGLPVQGNIDPAALFAAPARTAEAARAIVRAAAERPHVFNLGHGLDPKTPLDHVQHLIAALRRSEGRGR